jgi:hypothetical protein
MAAILEDVIKEARRELVIMTGSTRPYEPLRTALAAAIARAVAVDVVGELTWAGSALSASEPATAFAGLQGVSLWHWPPRNRATARARITPSWRSPMANAAWWAAPT